MLLTATMPDATEFEIRDVTGRQVSGVMAYDTDTKELEMLLFDKTGPVVFPYGDNCYEPVTVQCFLPGSYAIDKRTGKRVG